MGMDSYDGRDPIAQAASEATTAGGDDHALDAIAHMLRDPEWGVGMAGGHRVPGVRHRAEHPGDVRFVRSPAYCSVDERCEYCYACPQHEQQPTWDRH